MPSILHTKTCQLGHEFHGSQAGALRPVCADHSVPPAVQLYNRNTNAWASLPEAAVTPMLTDDAQGMYRQDNHGWLFAWSNATVFQARGPGHLQLLKPGVTDVMSS